MIKRHFVHKLISVNNKSLVLTRPDFKRAKALNGYLLSVINTESELVIPPQTLFVEGILFSHCLSVRPFITIFFLNILQIHC